MKRTIKLDTFEKGIEAHIDGSVPITGEKRRRIEAILERSRKTKNIYIRINEYDLTPIPAHWHDLLLSQFDRTVKVI